MRAAKGPNQVALASVRVTNTGPRAGVAVPQLYISKPVTAALPQPVRQLVGYASVPLARGASTTVTFPLNDRSFASWSTSGWTVSPGCYRLAVGSSSRTLTGSATVARGAGCAAASARLGTTGDFRLPLPAAATVGAGPVAPTTGPPPRPSAGHGGLASTGASTPALALAVLLLGGAAVAGRRVRRTR